MMSGRGGEPAVARSRSILRFGAEAVSARGGPSNFSSETESPLAVRPRPSSMFEEDSVCDGDLEMNLAPDCCCGGGGRS